MLPACVFLILFSYVPMFGIIMAFQDFTPTDGIFGSSFVGFDNFVRLFTLDNIQQVMFNTLYISIMKIILGLLVPILFALLLNEVRNRLFVRSVQTIVYLPYFLSWVILAGVFIEILSPSNGLVNHALKIFGIDPIFFLGDKSWFPNVIIITDTWKSFGFGTIVYLAALTSIDPSLYEAAKVDGANYYQQMRHITLPGITNIVVLMTVLSIGSILDAGFDQIYNLYNPVVYETGDILDTFVYRLGIKDMLFSISTAVSLIKSIVSFVLIVISYRLAYRLTEYKIF
ncbi:ABC transporter permease [Cohnella herbarum]|uniref:Sugar ABC transporter permease n=1 Tax=Cohnella herbarum TaxID=2728023 RepID=A0A7Z2VS84_9BACL|nr:ABC transporter permease subunit [Cohnella herbarum]QJD88195.1 sugar ABC transporter permease [Cohnella herbarum]